MELTPSQLHSALESLSGLRLEVEINRNLRSVLSKKRSGWRRYRLSIHQRFCSAPIEVLESVAAWLRGRPSRNQQATLRHFIHADLNEKQAISPLSLETQGGCFDLLEIYQRINRTYFDNQVDLWITWYGQRRVTRTLGLYCSERELVKIHRFLDRPQVPPEVVDFVVYHEMLHHVVPPLIDKAGRKRVHNATFRKREKCFRHYEFVQQWEKGEFCRGRT